jgi:predicted transcriptional regulator
VPPRKSPTLTEAELRIMEVLWQKGAGTIQQVLEWLPPKPALAYNSVLTTVRVLEKKGYVEHVKDGRAHVYQALLGRKQASQSEIRHLINRFFGDSHEELVLNILEDRGLDADEIRRLRQMLQAEVK